MNAEQATVFSAVVSALSLIVSIVSIVMNYRLSIRDKKRSEQLTEVQMRLQELQLLKEEEEAKRRQSSRVEARHVPVGMKGHHIRISNTGGTTVTNVTCECDEECGPYALMHDKEPFEHLEPGESFDEAVLFTMNTPSKFVITTRWVGSDGQEYSRENIITW